MAHVHGAAKGAAEASKHAAHAAHHSAHAAHAAAEHSTHLAHAAHHSAHAAHAMVPVVAKGAVAVAGAQAGRSFLGRLFGHPLVLFGLGVAVGYAVHKYRKEIIETANRAAEQGKDYVLQQRENLEDLMAEQQGLET